MLVNVYNLYSSISDCSINNL
uniref:Uncharacterized protein n=1 Tax=Rhizophora mucronata TaxID=61149 RepID=A0A2P2QBN1_RHIMU